MPTKPILIGKRTILRPIRAEDADEIFAQFGDPEVDRLTGTTDTFTLEQVRNFYGRIPDADDRVDYAIIPKDQPDRLVGEVVLNDIDWDAKSASFRIAIFLSENFGRGYGSDATREIVKYGFETLNLHRIELEVYDFNPRAAHVYEKIGFIREGVRRDVLLWDGKYQSAIIMAMLESDYKKQIAKTA